MHLIESLCRIGKIATIIDAGTVREFNNEGLLRRVVFVRERPNS